MHAPSSRGTYICLLSSCRQITRVQQNSTSCRVLCVGSQALSQEFKGTIRQQDVRATEIDKVVMYDCFRPGDVVRAEVVSLGDARSYYLSTAKNELGVVWAKSVSGYPMIPASWTTMTCPETMAVEKRKVAKVLETDKRKPDDPPAEQNQDSRKAAKLDR
ncbi:hypothetical protein DUNSADRAFT_15570 [Dunaliella salina]|uniref:Exosome complex component CSL4 C-terminal domain-containing protein n=1 Tax=Dunaliella salina TaxID=3046 RepID=A0ABQ7G552_DUNSA|nr:hypothetical protein DUNSADRAFT_15570 [Dunaliella salina]|eukprot:KAF5829723.1 hypothetical protein DUNSADRAFT_15570 [Dunaliella salina]